MKQLLVRIKKIEPPTWWLIGIMTAGLILRLYHIGSQSLWIDESFSAAALPGVVKNGVPGFVSGALYNRADLYHYPAGWLYAVFGRNAAILRSLSTLFGMVSIYITYYLGSKVFRNPVYGLIGASFVAFGTFDIAWSRQIRMYSELQMFFLSAVTFFYLFLQEKEIKRAWKKLALSAVFALAAIKTHTIAIVILPAYFAMALFYWRNYLKNFKVIIAGVLLALVVLYLSGGLRWFHLLEQIYLNPQFYFDDYFAFIFKNHLFELLMFVVAVVFACFKKQKDVLMFILAFALIYCAFGINRGMGMRYIYMVMPIFYLIASYGVVELWKLKNVLGKVAVVGAFTAVMLWQPSLVIWPQETYFLEYRPMMENGIVPEYTPQPNFKKTYDYLKSVAKPDDIFIVAHSAIQDWYMPDSKAYRIYFTFKGRKETAHALPQPDGSMIDEYTGIPVLKTPQELADLIKTHHGYVIWDYFSASHINPGFQAVVAQSAAPIIKDRFKQGYPWTIHYVYKF